MLANELLKLVEDVRSQKAEAQTTELKKAQEGCPRRLYDTLSSFSNQDGGGTIIFGVDETDDYKVTGVYDLQDLQKKVTEQCNQMEEEGAWICSAEIPGLDLSERPCYYRGAGRIKGSFIRVGEADLPMTDYELYSYEAFRKHLHDDERQVERASIELMNKDKLEDYLIKRRADRPGFAQLTKDQAYEMLNITRDGIPTLAAVMNFAIYPQGYFPQLGITAITVPGTMIGDTDLDDSRFLDNKRIEGTITDMVDEALTFCKRNMKTRTLIDPETGKRIDRTEYPIAAIREAVLNALIHRDYSVYTEGTPVQIDFFADRLEIHSPGSLYGRMTVDQLGFAKPDLRNPALAVMTEVLTGAENRYSGIPTMRRALAEYGLPEPKFENRRNEFVVTFYNETFEINNSASELTAAEKVKKGKDLLDFCRIPRSRQEIADYLGVGTVFYAVQHYVKPLVDKGRLAMTIPDKPRSRNQKYYTAE